MLTFRKPRRRHLTMMASLVIALLNLQAMAAGEIDLSFIGTAVRTHNSNPTELRIAAAAVLPHRKVFLFRPITGAMAKRTLLFFRPSTGIWYRARSMGGFTATHFGVATDTPPPNSFTC